MSDVNKPKIGRYIQEFKPVQKSQENYDKSEQGVIYKSKLLSYLLFNIKEIFTLPSSKSFI